VFTKPTVKAIAPSALLLLAAVMAIAAKDGAGPADDDARKARLALKIAEIDGRPLTLDYLESAAEKQSPIIRKSLLEADKRREFLDKLINMELLAAEAAKRGYDEHAEVTSVRKNQLASLMHKHIADSILEAEPSDEEMRKYYEEHSDSYNKPEKVRARHIQIADEQKAKKLLEDILAKKPSQYEFRRMAQDSSEDEATRLRGGDLTFFPRTAERTEGDPEVPEPVVEACFALKENGDVHPALVKSERGFHIVMRTGHRDRMSLSFEDAKERLALLVRREKRKGDVEAAIDALEDRFEVTLHEENLKDVVIDLSGGPPEPSAKGGLTAEERDKLKDALKESAPTEE